MKNIKINRKNLILGITIIIIITGITLSILVKIGVIKVKLMKLTNDYEENSSLTNGTNTEISNLLKANNYEWLLKIINFRLIEKGYAKENDLLLMVVRNELENKFFLYTIITSSQHITNPDNHLKYILNNQDYEYMYYLNNNIPHYKIYYACYELKDNISTDYIINNAQGPTDMFNINWENIKNVENGSDSEMQKYMLEQAKKDVINKIDTYYNKINNSEYDSSYYDQSTEWNEEQKQLDNFQNIDNYSPNSEKEKENKNESGNILAQEKMPNLIGLNLTEACNKLDSLGIKYELKTVPTLSNSENVISQSIPAGTKLSDIHTIVTIESYSKVSVYTTVTIRLLGETEESKALYMESNYSGTSVKVIFNGQANERMLYHGRENFYFDNITTPTATIEVYIKDKLMATQTVNIEDIMEEKNSKYYAYLTIDI